jgi:hypothetical protein
VVLKLTLRYDKIGDILYVDKCPPYAEQESDEIGDEIIARFNPKTSEVETIEILFFTKRLEKGETIEIPVTGELRLAETLT